MERGDEEIAWKGIVSVQGYAQESRGCGRITGVTACVAHGGSGRGQSLYMSLMSILGSLRGYRGLRRAPSEGVPPAHDGEPWCLPQ